MQRVVSIPYAELSIRAQQFLTQLPQLEATLALADPALSTIFALPERQGEQVDFYTRLEGELAEVTAAQGQERCAQAKVLLQSLQTGGQLSAQQAADALYFINNPSCCKSAGGVFFIVPAETAAQAAAIAAAAATVPVAAATRSHLPCLLALLGLLLLLLLLFLLWWFKLKPWPFADEPALAPEPVAATAPAVPEPEPKAEPEAEPEPAAEPVLSAEPEPEPVLPPEPEPEVKEPAPAQVQPPEPVKVEPAPVKPAAPAPSKVESAPAPAAPVKKLPKCSTLVQTKKMPALIMGIDGSVSMLQPDVKAAGGAMMRLQAAHESALELVRSIDKNVPVGLVEINRCPKAMNRGYFGGNNRHALEAAISQIIPKGDGTALISGLRSMASMAAGRGEAVGVLLSDGMDTCPGTRDQDVCAVARDIHRQFPQFKINVMLIGEEAYRLRCVAEITGGKIYTPKSALDFTKGLQQAGAPLNQVCEE